MTKSAHLSILCLVLFSWVSGQEPATPSVPARTNTVYFELLGNAGIWSINYEHLFRLPGTNSFLRAGLSEWHSEDTDSLNFIAPLEAGIVLGSKKHSLDLGLGVTVDLGDNAGHTLVMRAGYRYMADHGFLLRLSPAMLIIALEEETYGPYWVGIGLGYTFK